MGNAIGGNSYTQTELILFNNTLHAGYFFMFCRLLTFFKIKLFKKIFRNTMRVSNSLNPDQDGHFVRPDLGPNCLKRSAAEDYLLAGWQ